MGRSFMKLLAAFQDRLSAWRRRSSRSALARLWSAYDDLEDAILIYSMQAELVYSNTHARALIEILSHSGQTILPTGLTAFDRDGKRVERADWPLFRALRGEPVSKEEFQFVLPHVSGAGRHRHVRISAKQSDFAGLHPTPLILVSFTDITDLKTVERRLRDSEEAARREEARLTAVLDALPTAVVVADRDGRFVRMNAANESQVGFVHWAADIADYDVFEGYSPHTGARLASTDWPLARAIQKGEVTVGRRIDVRGGDGAIRHLSFSAAPIYDGDGTVAGGVVACEDVSGLVQAKSEAALVGAQLRLLIDGARDHAFFMLDRDGCVMTWSAAAERIKQHRAAEVMGLPWSSFFTPADVAKGVPAALLHEAERSGAAYFQGWRVRKDGSPFWVDAVVSAIHDQGELVGFAEVARDLTEQRLSQAELQLRDQAMQAVAQGILIVDARDPCEPIVHVSGGFERLTGYTASEAMGRNCRFLQGAQSDPAAIAAIRDGLRAGFETSVEILNYRKDGSTFWNALHISPVRGEDQQVDKFIGLMADVTERRELEDRLQQAHKMDALGRLAGGVAHDFNNILTIICGNVEELQLQATHGTLLRQRLDLIARAAKRASLLTHQLLTFSKASIVALAPLNLRDIIEQMKPLLASLIDDSMTFDAQVAADLRPIVADRSQIEQVLLNLAINARDALSSSGAVRLEAANAVPDDCKRMNVADAGSCDWVLLRITDNGAGMPPEVRERAFEPFFTTKGENGSGLGLATVFGIVSQAGGCVRLDSRPGGGTTVEIILPAARDPVIALPTYQDPPAREDRKLTVLVAEDEDDVRELVVRALQEAGHIVHDFDNGLDALAHIQNRDTAFDVLISDVVMPGIGGISLQKAAVAVAPRLRTLFMTGYHASKVTPDERTSHMISKPFTGQMLLKAVERLSA